LTDGVSCAATNKTGKSRPIMVCRNRSGFITFGFSK
jgi:hypothetical protein